jgi:hypothetical protein
MKNPIPFLCALLICFQTGWSIPGITPEGLIDREKITEFYFDGDFQKVMHALEHFRKNNPNAAKDDRIFMFKYLSVVYAANPDTRDKAESYMYQLLKMVPTATLIDMYISDSIKAIFKNVKEEYQARMQYLDSKKSTEPDQKQVSAEPPPSPKTGADKDPSPGKNGRSKKWIWWTVGGVTVAGAVTAFVLLSGNNEEAEKPVTVVH